MNLLLLHQFIGLLIASIIMVYLLPVFIYKTVSPIMSKREEARGLGPEPYNLIHIDG